MARRRPPRALLGVLIALGVLLLIEGAARTARPLLPSWTAHPGEGTAIMAGHPTRLWGNQPGGERRNDQVTATINSLGLRGPEPGPRSGPRMMVLGDSTAFGHGVRDGQEYVHVAADRLGVEGINGAVAGYSIPQTRLLMEELGWSLDPTLLVISNLWSDNTFDAFHDEDLLASARLASMNPLSHSAALRLLASALGAPGGQRVITVSRLEPWPEGTVRRVPLPRYAELMDQLVRDAAERGVGVVFVRNANVHLLAPPGGPAPAWGPYFQVMEELATWHGVPMLDVGPLFAEAGGELFLDLMHPTAEGHRLIGEALARTLSDAGWPEAPLLGRLEPYRCQVEDVRPPEQDDSGAGSPQRRLFGG